MMYLVVETTLLIKEVKKLAVGLTTPEVKVPNLEVTPDCMVNYQYPGLGGNVTCRLTVTSVIGISSIV